MSDPKSPSNPSAGPGASSPAAATTTPCTAPCPPPDPWLRDSLAVMCPKDKAFLDDLRTRGVTITAYDRIHYEDPYYDGTKWTTKSFEGGGSTVGTHMNIVTKYMDKGTLRDLPSVDVAETIYHEGVHTGQPKSMPWSEKEYDAYTKEAQWTIDHGVAARPGFTTKDAAGKTIPDLKAIRGFVDKEYPIATDAPAKPGGAVYNVVGKDARGNTVTQNTQPPHDQKTRPPKAGDTYPGPQIEEPPGGRPAQSCQLKCC